MTTGLRPGEITQQCVHLKVQRIAAATKARYKTALSSTGLNPDEFLLLANLAEQGPKNVTQATAILDTHIKGPKKVVHRLERRGLVAVGWSLRDSRSREVSLTKAGHDLLTKAAPLWLEIQRDLEASFDIADLMRAFQV